MNKKLVAIVIVISLLLIPLAATATTLINHDLKPAKFSFTYKPKNSEIKFEKYDCKIEKGLCWYWLQYMVVPV